MNPPEHERYDLEEEDENNDETFGGPVDPSAGNDWEMHHEHFAGQFESQERAPAPTEIASAPAPAPSPVSAQPTLSQVKAAFWDGGAPASQSAQSSQFRFFGSELSSQGLAANPAETMSVADLEAAFAPPVHRQGPTAPPAAPAPEPSPPYPGASSQPPGYSARQPAPVPPSGSPPLPRFATPSTSPPMPPPAASPPAPAAGSLQQLLPPDLAAAVQAGTLTMQQALSFVAAALSGAQQPSGGQSWGSSGPAVPPVPPPGPPPPPPSAMGKPAGIMGHAPGYPPRMGGPFPGAPQSAFPMGPRGVMPPGMPPPPMGMPPGMPPSPMGMPPGLPSPPGMQQAPLGMHPAGLSSPPGMQPQYNSPNALAAAAAAAAAQQRHLMQQLQVAQGLLGQGPEPPPMIPTRPRRAPRPFFGVPPQVVARQPKGLREGSRIFVGGAPTPVAQPVDAAPRDLMSPAEVELIACPFNQCWDTYDENYYHTSAYMTQTLGELPAPRAPSCPPCAPSGPTSPSSPPLGAPADR
ncbi:hypothetical protein PAPYR_3805 [Paratrimastix pyriformis]|uniref:Uncharacterized protein n=1 Tax=Paratrimastix pyriformis TaxID=342808 RepID=A0ABQ8UP64_9EUKA|nr:hypothetical protein PAPYR_3805 [Paratrimastix pyriformis]